MTTSASAGETITLAVAGMTCGSCARNIRQELGKVSGFHDARVELEQGRVAVTYDPTAATAEQIVGAVTRAGYPAEMVEPTAEGERNEPKSCGCCVTRGSLRTGQS